MSITSTSGRTPVADKYRAYVLAGLDQLQAEVTAAGGIEAFVRGRIPGAKTAQITWNGEFLDVSSETYLFEGVEIPAIVVPEAVLTTEVGTIQLAEWWERQPESLTASCEPIRWTDPESVQDLRELWLKFLYPSEENFGQDVASLIANGQMPINIELEAVGLTPRALPSLHLTWRPDDAKEISNVISKTIVDYYLIQKKAPWAAPDAELEKLIWDWVLKDDTKLQTAYLAAKEVTA